MLHGARDYLWLHREAGQSGGNGGPGGVNSEPSLAGLAPPEGLDLGSVLASRRATDCDPVLVRFGSALAHNSPRFNPRASAAARSAAEARV